MVQVYLVPASLSGYQTIAYHHHKEFPNCWRLYEIVGLRLKKLLHASRVSHKQSLRVEETEITQHAFVRYILHPLETILGVWLL